MRKRAFLTVAIIISTIFILCLLLFIAFYQKPLNKIMDGHKTAEETGILKDAVLLEKLESDKSPEALQKLLELAAYENAAGYYAKLALAERYLDSGKDSVPIYREALGLYDTRDVHGKLAFALEKQGSLVDAAMEYGLLLPDAKWQEQLLKLPVEPEVIGEVLIKYKQWQTALDFLKAKIDVEADKGKKTNLEKYYARALAELSKYKDALPLIERLLPEGLSDDNLKLWYGRSLEATGQTAKAKDVYKSLGDKGAARLGALLEKGGDINGAAASYVKSSEVDFIWKGARIFDEAGAYVKAIDAYLALSKIPGTYQDDASYRAFVLTKRVTNKENSEALSLLSKYPVWMTRLDKEVIWDSVTEITYDKPEFLKLVEAYKSSGRPLMAQIELSIGQKNASLPQKLALGDWYLSQGDYAQAAIWGMRAIKEQPVMHGYELAYLKPYSDEIFKSAKEYNIDPYLLWALMREESYYKSDAVSRVGALGLMQIMPSTAKDIASRLKVKFNEKDLLEPGQNIRFGAFYLGSMLAMFSGDVDKALAAYNGGAGNVGKWRYSKLGSTKEDFPTAISFLETRDYITKVSNSYLIYKKLYGNK